MVRVVQATDATGESSGWEANDLQVGHLRVIEHESPNHLKRLARREGFEPPTPRFEAWSKKKK